MTSIGILSRNVAANFIGQGWRALMNLAFIPVYIRFLGVEAYGLIGVYAILHAALNVLDFGLRPSLMREMARFRAGAHDAQSIRNLLRSVEIAVLLIALSIAAVIVLSAPWLSVTWLRNEQLSTEQVARALQVVGFVLALRLLETLYVSSLAGLQRQVLENVIGSIAATLRGVGVIAVLAWISPTIEAFFIWQLVVSVVTTLMLRVFVHRSLPAPELPARFSYRTLLSIWRFASGMVLISILALLLTQLDKVLLSRILQLSDFAYYALAASVAGGLVIFSLPITSAFYPRLIELLARPSDEALRKDYHLAAQLISVIAGSAAFVIVFFADHILILWTRDPELVASVTPLLRVLSLGTLCNILMAMPYQLQLAFGWTALTIKVNSIAVLLLAPALLIVAPRYGAPGAAYVWLALNLGYLLIAVHFVHRRLLSGEQWRWYSRDLALPLSVAAGITALARWLMPLTTDSIVTLIILLFVSGTVVIATAYSAPLVRISLFRFFGQAWSLAQRQMRRGD